MPLARRTFLGTTWRGTAGGGIRDMLRLADLIWKVLVMTVRCGVSTSPRAVPAKCGAGLYACTFSDLWSG